MFVAICDDDPEALARYSSEVERLCEQHGIALQLAPFETGSQMLRAIATQGAVPDIVLLDIVMPEMDGVDVAAMLRDKGFGGVIVFITKQGGRMLDAFDVDAFNYVVKNAPGESERFARVFIDAVGKVRRKQRRYLLCHGTSEHRSIPLDTIRYFSMKHHMCTVHYGKDLEFEFKTTLGRLDNMLAASGFVRIQRSFTVNCAHVTKYSFRSCTLDDGTQLTVSRNHAATLREAMQSRTQALTADPTRPR